MFQNLLIVVSVAMIPLTSSHASTVQGQIEASPSTSPIQVNDPVEGTLTDSDFATSSGSTTELNPPAELKSDMGNRPMTQAYPRKLDSREQRQTNAPSESSEDAARTQRQ